MEFELSGSDTSQERRKDLGVGIVFKGEEKIIREDKGKTCSWKERPGRNKNWPFLKVDVQSGKEKEDKSLRTQTI